MIITRKKLNKVDHTVPLQICCIKKPVRRLDRKQFMQHVETWGRY